MEINAPEIPHTIVDGFWYCFARHTARICNGGQRKNINFAIFSLIHAILELVANPHAEPEELQRKGGIVLRYIVQICYIKKG